MVGVSGKCFWHEKLIASIIIILWSSWFRILPYLPLLSRHHYIIYASWNSISIYLKQYFEGNLKNIWTNWFIMSFNNKPQMSKSSNNYKIMHYIHYHHRISIFNFIVFSTQPLAFVVLQKGCISTFAPWWRARNLLATTVCCL